MTPTFFRFISLLLASLLAGTMFGVWLGFNPSALTATAYVEMQQTAIRALNISLPALGLVCILLTAALAVLTKNDKRGRYLLVAAVIFHRADDFRHASPASSPRSCQTLALINAPRRNAD